MTSILQGLAPNDYAMEVDSNKTMSKLSQRVPHHTFVPSQRPSLALPDTSVTDYMLNGGEHTKNPT